MKKTEDKYIDLLLLRCINFKQSKSLFISFEEENISFVKRLVELDLVLAKMCLGYITIILQFLAFML